MVCISCILIPLALYIWHRFLQPVFLKMWNPFAKVEDQVSFTPSEIDSFLSTNPKMVVLVF